MISYAYFIIILSALAYYAEAIYRPVVLWHGMGDSCCNPDSMGKIQELINDTLPGTYTYSIMLGKDEGEDKKA
ncbi:5603_t:CDS:2, partial [Acaulospora morrowiae]